MVIKASTFKATCLALLDQVHKTGLPILITKKGKVAAQLCPPPPAETPAKWLGCGIGTGKVLGDIVSPAVEEKDWEALQS
jgi:prevent-host-death family protein